MPAPELVLRGSLRATSGTLAPGALHRGRFYHVHFKPLYEAIGEANNRHRKAASLGRCVERLMLLDAVRADHRYAWLGTEQDKRTYFREALERELPDDWYPHLTFHNGTEKTTRFFPDKMPIGVPVKGEWRHVFLYLATREIPMDFRVFLLRHADLLKAVDEWTIRVLMPRRLRRAATLYRHAVRDAFLMPLEPRVVRELDWYFRARRGEIVCPSVDPDLDIDAAARKYGAARFEALYRQHSRRLFGLLFRRCGRCSCPFFETTSSAVWAALNSSNSRTNICSSRRSSAPSPGLRRGSPRETT